MELVVREAKKSDLMAISSLLTSLSETHIASSFPPEGKMTLLKSMEPGEIRKYIESDFKYYVAESEGELVGVVAMREASHLYHLFVSEQYQGRGLGRKLWEIAKSFSLEIKSVEVFTVNSSLNAQGFYENLGFEIVGERVTVSGVTYQPMEIRFE